VLTRLLASRPRRVGIAVLGGGLLLLATWLVVDVARIRRDIDASERVLRSVKATDLAKPNGLARPARAALDRLRRADHRARTSVPFVVLRPIPVVGRQVAAVRDMTRIAVAVGTIGNDAARAIQSRLDGATEGAAGRVALLDTAVNEIARARVRLHRIEVPKDGLVLPPVRGARTSLNGSLASARGRLRDLAAMAGGLRRMFIGPSNYVVLAGNNAEMRSGGMPLSAGIIEIANGQVKVRRFVPSGQLFLKMGPVPVPRELQELYAGLSFGAEWRGTMVSPNFPAVGQVYAEMARMEGFGTVAGVLFVDGEALKSVVSATGPVDLDGITYSTDNIERELMNENYLRFGDPTDQDPRHDVQSRLGVAVFEALNNRPVELGKLVSSLSAAGKGRHIMAWSRDPNLRMVWRRAGIDGAINPNGLMVMMQNITANKLDWYLRPRINLRSVSVRRGVRRVALSVTVTNTPRNPTSDVVEGTEYTRAHAIPDGEHRTLLLLYLPRAATDVASADPPFSTAGTDGGMKVVGMRYGIALGETKTITITFTVPKRQRFVVIPSGRAHPEEYVTPNRSFKDDKPFVIAL
jgi:hypothetical protein